MIKLSEYEKKLIDTLREDARSLKDCYTTFSFQAIAFASAVLSIIARYQPEYPFFGLASVATIILLITVARIGTYKYASANRQYGYELHMFRVRNLKKFKGNGWKPYMREIGWEEAMRAWRVVQPTIFKYLYYTNRLLPNVLRQKHRKQSYQWFNPEKLSASNASYYAGSYLSVMNTILHILAALSSIPLFFMIFQLDAVNLLSWKAGIIFPIIVLLFIAHRFMRDSARVKILETGLLSIHSCSIMWQAVIVAHFRAIRDSNELRHYTENLAMQAHDLRENIFGIHDRITNAKPLGNAKKVSDM